jgi:uncharacterized membrane protein
MKKILILSFSISVALIGYGYFQKNNELNGEKWIGMGVLLLSFVVMPLFIYHRYKNKSVKDYLMTNFKPNNEKPENQ